MRHYGDITKLSGYGLPPVDCITGGSPCQDLSVAGNRAGLAGERSGLFLEQIRIVREMREHDRNSDGYFRLHPRPRFMVWENVPGAFSSNKGRDFQIVLTEIVRIKEPGVSDVPLPEKNKWPAAGVIYDELGGGWSIAWRVHDAQHWGVPQRRKRIALVADFDGLTAGSIIFGSRLRGEAAGTGSYEAVRDPGNGSRPEVHPLGESLSGDPEKGKTQGKEAAGTTGAGTDTTGAISFQERAGKPGGGKGILIQNERTGALSTLNNQSVFVFTGIQDKAICLQGNGIDRADTAGCNGRGWCEDVSYTLNTIDRPAVYAATLGVDDYKETQMVYDARGNGDGKTVPTLTGDHGNRVTDYTAITCYAMHGFGDYRERDTSSACKARDYKDATDLVVGTFQNTGQGWWKESDIGASIRCASGGREANVVSGTLQAKPVRRLTPMEWERLQGYPDHWTDIGEYTDTKGKTRKTTDSARYKALGNSIALPFWFYLLRRISAEYERPATLGSLFDGIGGFPLCWERCNGPGTALWASEIEEFPIAVTKRRFPE